MQASSLAIFFVKFTGDILDDELGGLELFKELRVEVFLAFVEGGRRGGRDSRAVEAELRHRGNTGSGSGSGGASGHAGHRNETAE